MKAARSAKTAKAAEPATTAAGSHGPARSTSTSTSTSRAPARPPWLRAAAVGVPVLLALLATALAVAWWLRRAPAGAAATQAPGLQSLSMAELLAGHSSDWRLARLQDNPAVMVIEFPNLLQQGAAMNRVAALLEKADAPRDRVLTDAELAALIERGGDNSQTFYQGHDYDGAGLARFYTLAQRQGLPLNPGEQRVKQALLTAGVLAAGAGAEAGAADSIRAQGVQALITFTATQPDDPRTSVDETVDERRRESILRHEASHGRFYTRPVYREHCRRFWRQVWTEAQREKMRHFLAGIGYDRRDEDLMLNEAQAFLMNTPDERAVNAAAVGLSDAELATLRARFWQTLPVDGDLAAAASGPVAATAATAAAAVTVPGAATRPAAAARP